MADQSTKGRGLPWFLIASGLGLLGAVAVGGWFYFRVLMHAPATPEGAPLWGVRGDAMGPFAAILNAGALFAALYAVHMQRVESHESGEATRQQLTMMGAQLSEFARAAQAQASLAESQKQLADAQINANKIAILTEKTQRLVASCTLQAAITHMHQAMAGHEYWRMYEPDRHGERAREQLGRMETTLDLISKQARESLRAVAAASSSESEGDDK